VRYVALWVVVAAAWAVAFGLAAGSSAAVAALDGAVFGIVAGFEGLILWNVLKYAAAGTPTAVGTPTADIFRVGRLSTYLATGILFVAVAVGAGSLAHWLAAGSLSPEFAATIPSRCLTAAAVFVCFVLWYSSADRSDGTGNARGGYPADAEAGDGEVVNGEAAEILERVTVRGQGGRIEVIPVSAIVCLQAEGDYVAIVTPAGRWLKEGTMKYFEGALPRDGFVRVHRSCIVSVAHISRIETSGRDHTLILRGGPTVRISDTGYRLLRRTLRL
jgi:hypothetical protein